MPTDATGTPSSPDLIPTYNTGLDAPSGKGLNSIVASLQTILNQIRAGTLPGGKLNAAAALTGLVPQANLGSGSAGAGAKFLADDQTYKTISSQKFTTSTLAGGPPGSPADGDIWIATGIGGTSKRWQFQYDSAETTYKWKFIGGTALRVLSGGWNNAADGTWQNSSGLSIAVARAGHYVVSWADNIVTSNVNPNYLGWATASGGTPATYSGIYQTGGGATAISLPVSGSTDTADEGYAALGAASSVYLNSYMQNHTNGGFGYGWLSLEPTKII